MICWEENLHKKGKNFTLEEERWRASLILSWVPKRGLFGCRAISIVADRRAAGVIEWSIYLYFEENMRIKKSILGISVESTEEPIISFNNYNWELTKDLDFQVTELF